MKSPFSPDDKVRLSMRNERNCLNDGNQDRKLLKEIWRQLRIE